MRKLFTNSNHICLGRTADLNVIANVNSNVEMYPMNFRHITGCKTHYWILNTSWFLFAVLGNETDASDRKVLVPGSWFLVLVPTDLQLATHTQPNPWCDFKREIEIQGPHTDSLTTSCNAQAQCTMRWSILTELLATLRYFHVIVFDSKILRSTTSPPACSVRANL